MSDMFFENTKKIGVKIHLTEELLGLLASDPQIHESFIASKAPDAKSMEEEIDDLGVEAVAEKGRTIFPLDEKGRPYMYDYQIKGFFKDACGMLRKYSGTESAKLKAYKKAIDGGIFVTARKNPIIIPSDKQMGVCERPLRASTAQGDRVALASSETVPEGSTMFFEVELFDPSYVKLLDEWLKYGTRHGLGAWRNSGKGTFTYEYTYVK